MRPPITNHQDYWYTKTREIPMMEDADKRGRLNAMEKQALTEFKNVVKEYEDKYPIIDEIGCAGCGRNINECVCL